MSMLDADPEPRGTEFDREIDVAPRGNEMAGSGVYDASLGDGGLIGAGVNGGLLLALAANALRHSFADTGHTDPVSISAYYLTASRPGAVTLHTEHCLLYTSDAADDL